MPNANVLDSDDRLEVKQADGVVKKLVEEVRADMAKPVTMTVERLPKDAMRLHRLVAKALDAVRAQPQGVGADALDLFKQMQTMTERIKKGATHTIRWKKKRAKVVQQEIALLERCRVKMVTLIYANENADKATKKDGGKGVARAGRSDEPGSAAGEPAVLTRTRAECLDGRHMRLTVSPFCVEALQKQ